MLILYSSRPEFYSLAVLILPTGRFPDSWVFNLVLFDFNYLIVWLTCFCTLNTDQE